MRTHGVNIVDALMVALKRWSHIINILLTSFVRSVRGKYRPFGLDSTTLAEAARAVLPRPVGPIFSPYRPHTWLIRSI